MLKLHRKTGETILIGDDIEVKVLKGTCSLGISAPQDVRILRGELSEIPVINYGPLAFLAATLANKDGEGLWKNMPPELRAVYLSEAAARLKEWQDANR